MKKALWFFIGIFLFFSVFLASSWAQWQIPRRGERRAKPPHGEWQIPAFKGEKPAKPPPEANLPEGEWQLPVFKEERAIKKARERGTSEHREYPPVPPTVVPSGPRILHGVPGGAYDQYGNFYPQSGNVYLDPKGGVIPKNVPTTSADPPVRILTPTPGGAVDQTGKFYPHSGPKAYIDSQTGNIIIK